MPYQFACSFRRSVGAVMAAAAALCLFAGCDRAPDPRTPEIQQRLDLLAGQLVTMHEENVKELNRIQTAQKTLSLLRDEAGYPPYVAKPAAPTAVRPAVQAPAPAEDPAKSAASGRFLRILGILCFTAFLVVQFAKVWRKRHQTPDPEPEPPKPVSTVYSSLDRPPATAEAESVVEEAPDSSDAGSPDQKPEERKPSIKSVDPAPPTFPVSPVEEANAARWTYKPGGPPPAETVVLIPAEPVRDPEPPQPAETDLSGAPPTADGPEAAPLPPVQDAIAEMESEGGAAAEPPEEPEPPSPEPHQSAPPPASTSPAPGQSQRRRRKR